ncbi:hypothetical protein [Candidatus Odyssella thessalonicensis]|uniref:hypothetical protein n=1 Tax=Candidatus Odyssella thessalonicensis TaxID=84647 RepID=UPI0002E9CFFA|nr:hypothetical protein [Candidatus Odyssella thessalonicensis]
MFFKKLIGMSPNEVIQQRVHQSRYLKNVLGTDIGLSEPVVFDRHSQLIYQNLIDLPKEGMLTEFYRHLLPSTIIMMVLKEANAELQQGMQLYNVIQAVIPEELQEAAWDIDIASDKVTLTEIGSVSLLKALGVLNAPPSN